MKNESCDPKETSLKSFFLGPQAENAEWVKTLFADILTKWVDWRRSVYPNDGQAISYHDQRLPEFVQRKEDFEKLVLEVVSRFENEIPKHSPRYIGHMFSEFSLPGLMGHVVTLLHNPNLVSGDAAKVGVELEEEAIIELNKMLNYPPQSTGHFTSGGTVANFEAMIRARARMARWLALSTKLRSLSLPSPEFYESCHMGWEKYYHLLHENQLKESDLKDYDFSEISPYSFAKIFEKIWGCSFTPPVVLIPNHKHYSWIKAVNTLGIGSDQIQFLELDKEGKICVKDLESKLTHSVQNKVPILMCVSVFGSTEFGTIDPLDQIVTLLTKNSLLHYWHHVDAAYGGFFCTIPPDTNVTLSVFKAAQAVALTTSATIDPHKLGYVPYSSGAFLCKNNFDYYVKSYQAPYIKFDQKVDRGPYTLEGSRSAGGAVATWLTAKCIGLNHEGYGLIIKRTIDAKVDLEKRLSSEVPGIVFAPGNHTNVVCCHFTKKGSSLKESNLRTKMIYDKFSSLNSHFMISKTHIYKSSYRQAFKEMVQTHQLQEDDDQIMFIRMCLMNPFFSSKETDISYPEEFLTELKSFLK